MLKDICDKLQFPQESIPVLENGLETIQQRQMQKLETCCTSLMTIEDEQFLMLMQEISDETGIELYTVNMIVLLYAAGKMPQVYAQNALPESLLWDSFMDLQYKLLECKAVYDVWGTFVPKWFKRFYTLERFKLGRLEFELIPYRWKETEGLSAGDPVINIHIPSAGPLPPEEVQDSFDRAYRFYRSRFNSDSIPFVCNSWMLYPPFAQQVFPENSNLRAFYDCFTIIDAKQDCENKDFWRIFHVPYSQDALRVAPADTTLRRNLLSYLRRGNTMGSGVGFFTITKE